MKVGDLVREYLNGIHAPQTAIALTSENLTTVTEAGEHLADGLTLLLSVLFDDVDIEPAPISATCSLPLTPWRVNFSWQASQLKQQHERHCDEDEDEESTAELP